MPGVMNFHAFRQQAFTTALPAPGQGCAARLRAHASAKTVLIFPGALGALQGAFHDVAFSRGATLGVIVRLSIPAPHLLRPPARSGDSEQDQEEKQRMHMRIANTFTLWNNRRTP